MEEGVQDELRERRRLLRLAREGGFPSLHLDNFDLEDSVPPECPFVLTSPRSLEACRIMGVKVSDSYTKLAAK